MPTLLLIFGENPYNRQFSWIKLNGRSSSRIDFWLVTPEIMNLMSNVSIAVLPLTAYCVIEITLKLEVSPICRRKYWKFIAKLLHLNEYVKLVKALITESNSNKDNYCKK